MIYYTPTKEELIYTKGIEYEILVDNVWQQKVNAGIVYTALLIADLRMIGRLEDYRVKALSITDLKNLMFTKTNRDGLYENDDFCLMYDDDIAIVKKSTGKTVFIGHVKNKAELINILSVL